MKKIPSFVALATLTILFQTSYAPAKGLPDLITITGPGLSQAVEITNPEILKQFSPWGGEFADWNHGTLEEAHCSGQQYDAHFFMKWEGRHSDYDHGDLPLVYVVRYCRGLAGSSGFIHLPGQGDKFYRLNIFTIYRKGIDGKWLYASKAWDALMERLLSPTDKPTVPDSRH